MTAWIAAVCPDCRRRRRPPRTTPPGEPTPTPVDTALTWRPELAGMAQVGVVLRDREVSA